MYESSLYSTQFAIPITDASQVGKARREVTALTKTLGFNTTETSKVAIVVTEIVGNLAKHSAGGEVLFRSLKYENINGIEILALDRGPGIPNVAKCLKDGYSSTTSSGTGLGAVVRLSAHFDIHSVPGAGTALCTYLFSRPLPKNHSPYEWMTGSVCFPKNEGEPNGDAWLRKDSAGRDVIILSDGLGYGALAATASHAALRIFEEHSNLAPAAMLEKIHPALHSTRGAAIGVAELHHDDLSVKYAGVGNIAGCIVSSEKQKNMVSHNGIVGHRIRTLKEFTYSLEQNACVVMHSDGLTTHWALNHYPGLMKRHPSLIAGVLYRDYCRGSDDVAVVVARLGERK